MSKAPRGRRAATPANQTDLDDTDAGVDNLEMLADFELARDIAANANLARHEMGLAEELPEFSY